MVKNSNSLIKYFSIMETTSENDANSGSSLNNVKYDYKLRLRNLNSGMTGTVSDGTALPILERDSTATDHKVYHEENEDYIADVMTSSYTEISFEQGTAAGGEKSLRDELSDATFDQSQPDSPDNQIKTDKRRPSSLILNSNSEASSAFTNLESGIQNDENTSPLLTTASVSGIRCCDLDENFSWSRIMEDRGQQTSASSQISIDGSPSLSSEELLSESQGRNHYRHRRGHRRMGSDTSGLSELAGTLIVEGDVLSFVADDLQEKIRLSSPLSRRDSPSFPSSRVSTPSLYKQALQPQVPLVDAGALADLEAHALRVASGVDHMLENLSGTVQSISSLTVDCMETYEKSVCKTCDIVDSNIKSMYQLMAKCEELSNSMKPLYKVAEEIKEIKRLVDHFENVMEQKS